MSRQLKVSVCQASVSGRKPINQDSAGFHIPSTSERNTKGIAAILCDGISSSKVSQSASATAVTSFLDDYYATSEAWTVKHSAKKVLEAINHWLYAQTQNSPYRFNFNEGYVCTASALIIKARSAHVFHCGDSRLYIKRNGKLELITRDHRRYLDQETSYLSNALGMSASVELDYHTIPLNLGDTLILATDGLYEFLTEAEISQVLNNHDLKGAHKADELVRQAFANGSKDNISVIIAHIESLPDDTLREWKASLFSLPLPPVLEPGHQIDGFKIIRALHITSRSHVFLAKALLNDQLVVIKTPSIESRTNEQHTDSILMENWIAKRLHSPYLLKPYVNQTPPSAIYSVTQYVQGTTLGQWLDDHPAPSLNQVRNIVMQIASGLQTMHRQQMLHQDLRPENIMIDEHGTAIIIDFGSTYVMGLSEMTVPETSIPGTAQFSAPEYFLGHEGNTCSDVYSLGVLTYYMLTGHFPYGTDIAKATTAKAQQKLRYVPAYSHNEGIPTWVDYALHNALRIEPTKRYPVISEFMYDLKHPNPSSQIHFRLPIAERNPVLFWQRISLILSVLLVLALWN